MSGDTFVLRFADRMDKNENTDDTIIYILYDHYNKCYLIRGNRKSKKNKTCDFSHYCDTIEAVSNFLKIIYKNFYSLSISLCNYRDLPAVSSEICYYTLDLEFKNKQFSSNVAVFDYETATNENIVINYEKYLQILENFYSDHDL